MDRANFIWDGVTWTTAAMLTIGHTNSPASGPAGKAVPVRYAPEGRDDQPLTGAEIAVVTWAVNNLPLLWDALVPAVFTYYQSVRAHPDGLDPDDLPALASTGDLPPLINIEAVYVHQVSKNGHPYVGFDLGCTWDKDHGLGVLMNGSRVVEIGGADTAILLWIAQRDRRSVD